MCLKYGERIKTWPCGGRVETQESEHKLCSLKLTQIYFAEAGKQYGSPTKRHTSVQVSNPATAS